MDEVIPRIDVVAHGADGVGIGGDFFFGGGVDIGEEVVVEGGAEFIILVEGGACVHPCRSWPS